MGILTRIFNNDEITVERLDTEIANLTRKRDEVAAQIESAEADVPAEVIHQGASRSAKIASNLRLELDGIDRTLGLLRSARNDAQAEQEAEALAKRWRAVRAMIPGLISDAREVAEAISHLWQCVRKLMTSITQFEHALPARAPDFEPGEMAKRLSGLCMRHAFVVSNGAIVGGSFHSHPAELAKTGTADVVAGIKGFSEFALKAAPVEGGPESEKEKAA